MDLTSLPSSVTQIVYLVISADKDLKDKATETGTIWLQALDTIEGSAGYQRLYWGRSVEQPEKVQLHVVRSALSDHQSYLTSSSYSTFLKHIQPLLDTTNPQPKTRHVTSLTTYTSKPTTPFHAPVTGTAIYLSTTPAWHEGSWPCWTHVVRHVKGCTGIAGGKLLEPVNSKDSSPFAGVSSKETQITTTAETGDCFIVYVGWESIKDHSNYHHTQHFRDHSVILRIGHSGWREYGHIKFEGWRGEGESEPDAKNLSKL